MKKDPRNLSGVGVPFAMPVSDGVAGIVAHEVRRLSVGWKGAYRAEVSLPDG